MLPVGIFNFLASFKAGELFQAIDEKGFLDLLKKQNSTVAAKLVSDEDFITAEEEWTPKKEKIAIRSAIFLLLRQMIKTSTVLPTAVKNSHLADLWRDRIDDKVVVVTRARFAVDPALNQKPESFVDTVAKSMVEVIF